MTPSRQQFKAQSNIRASTLTEQSKRMASLNREILTASQSYNNSPKPFSRQETQAPVFQQTGNKTSLSYSVRVSEPQQVRYSQQQLEEAGESSGRNEHRTNELAHETQGENLASKLVHKQYNSPIDLYSMNNIRKTIEAHTELIAPGLKGINFMKSDAPVNKQSEVYKLVMEEEQRGQQASTRLSPISGEPLNLPSALAGQSVCTQQATRSSQSSTHHHFNSMSQDQTLQASSSEQSQSIKQQGDSSAQSADQMPRQPNLPICCECGRYIVGPYAKIQNRSVHPQCFNCTTCGTSLKNTGYFTVNEKLYCEIHAKQVASIMRIQYDFSDKQGLRQHSLDPCQAARQTTNQETGQQSHRTSSYAATNTTQQTIRMQSLDSRSPATISTMFANRGGSKSGGEVSWTWRPATSIDTSTTTNSSNSNAKTLYETNCQNQEVRAVQSPSPTMTSFQKPQLQQKQSQQQQGQEVISSVQNRSSVQNETRVGGRIPFCVHCNEQIQGPYILAGRTTWCKLCSQTKFNCSSCHKSLLDSGFIEDSSRKHYCEHCFEAYYAPVCSKCSIRIKGDCLNALNKQWHPSCFVCGHCHRPFGNSSFYLEDNVPYCERDWNMLFTTKCYSCSFPIEAGDKWIEALDRNYHSNCFRCTSCQANLEGSTFYCKGGKPYCRMHAR